MFDRIQKALIYEDKTYPDDALEIEESMEVHTSNPMQKQYIITDKPWIGGTIEEIIDAVHESFDLEWQSRNCKFLYEKDKPECYKTYIPSKEQWLAVKEEERAQCSQCWSLGIVENDVIWCKYCQSETDHDGNLVSFYGIRVCDIKED